MAKFPWEFYSNSFTVVFLMLVLCTKFCEKLSKNSHTNMGFPHVYILAFKLNYKHYFNFNNLSFRKEYDNGPGVILIVSLLQPVSSREASRC